MALRGHYCHESAHVNGEAPADVPVGPALDLLPPSGTGVHLRTHRLFSVHVVTTPRSSLTITSQPK